MTIEAKLEQARRNLLDLSTRNRLIRMPRRRKRAKIEGGLERSRILVLCTSAHAFDSDWAHLESGTFRFRDPLNKERRVFPLRLDDTPIKVSLPQFLHGDWVSAGQERLGLHRKT
jgi:TIR domain